jgi:hypothetical protein
MFKTAHASSTYYSKKAKLETTHKSEDKEWMLDEEPL